VIGRINHAKKFSILRDPQITDDQNVCTSKVFVVIKSEPPCHFVPHLLGNADTKILSISTIYPEISVFAIIGI